MSGTPTRAAEARASAAAFLDGAGDIDVIVRDFPDRYFPAHYEAVKDAVRSAAAGFEPDLVFTHQRNDLHQDHRLLSELTLNTFRDHLILEYEVSKYDGDLGQTNLYVDIDRHTVDRKVALLMTHFPTQRDRDWFDADTFRALMRLRGVECHASEGYAEAYYGRKIRLL